MSRNILRLKRRKRIRAKIIGTGVIPRVAVFRSNKNLYLQAIDDQKGVTLAFASTLKDKDPAGRLAQALLSKRIKKIVFDRGGYLYHGKVKQLAQDLRAAGLEF